jgi:uncharacterized peroxidase-related enzyme
MSWIEEANLPDLPAIFQALSLNSEALEAVKGLNETLAFGGSTLSRVQEEAIATVVAVANRCRYGALTHGGFLRRHSGDTGLASQLLSDYSQAKLPAPDLKMLDFALKVTVEPSSLTEDDLDGLRDAGFLEQDILSIVLVTCLFNFMNRVASSLGVRIPGSFQRVVESWLTGPATQNTWMLRPGDEAPQDPSDQARKPASRPPGISVARGRKVPGGQRGTAVGRKHRVTPEEEDGPEDAPGPRRRPSGKTGRRGSVRNSAPEDTSQGADPRSYPSLEEDTAKDASPRPSGPEDFIGGEDLRLSLGLAGDTALGDTERTFTTEEAGGEEDFAPPSDLEEDTPEGEGEGEDEGAATPPTGNLEAIPLSRFLDETCIVSSDQAAPARALYIAYLRWCDENREKPWRQRNFGLALTGLGFRRRRRGQGRHWWMGLAVRSGTSESV